MIIIGSNNNEIIGIPTFPLFYHNVRRENSYTFEGASPSSSGILDLKAIFDAWEEI